MEQKLKGPAEYIKEAWGIYIKKENFIFFAKIMAVLVVITTVVSFIFGYFYPSDYLKNFNFNNTPKLIGFILISLFAGILNLWSQTTQYCSVLKIGESEKEVFQIGYKKMWKFLMVSLVLTLIILGGTILLVVPAIIFGVWYSFTVWLVLDKGSNIGEALKTSKVMVKGKFWKVLGRFVVFGLFGLVVSILLSIIPYTGSLLTAFVAPLFLLLSYLLYRDLSVNN